MKTVKLDKEEQELFDSVERGEWKSVKNLKGEIKRHQQYAKNTLKKDRRVNIRVSSKDLEELQTSLRTESLPSCYPSCYLSRGWTNSLTDSQMP